jgi:hypothetical protein
MAWKLMRPRVSLGGSSARRLCPGRVGVRGLRSGSLPHPVESSKDRRQYRPPIVVSLTPDTCRVWVARWGRDLPFLAAARNGGGV